MTCASDPAAPVVTKPTSSDGSKQEAEALLNALNDVAAKTGVPRVRYDALHRVTSVWLNTTFATDQNITLLDQFAHLREAKISCAPVSITPVALTALSNLARLEQIELRGASEHITREIVTALGRIGTLKTIIIRDSEIEPDALASLQALPHLEVLKVSGTEAEFTDLNIPAVAKLSHLTDLDISHTGVTNSCLNSLAKLPRLKHLTVIATKVSEAGVRGSQLSGKVDVVGARLTPSGPDLMR